MSEIIIFLPDANNFVVEHFRGKYEDFENKIKEHIECGFEIARRKDNEVLLKKDTTKVVVKIF